MKEYTAKTKFIRSSAQKARIPADIIRGMNAHQAVNILEVMPKKAARQIKKVVESAIANAEYAQEENVDLLTISTITIDQGPGYKRYKEGGRGSYKPFKRPTCHVTVVLAASSEQQSVDSKKPETKSKSETSNSKPVTKDKKETKAGKKVKTQSSKAKAESTSKKSKPKVKSKSTSKSKQTAKTKNSKKNKSLPTKEKAKV